MKKNILPFLLVAVLAGGCCCREYHAASHTTSHAASHTTSAITDNTYNSPTYDRVIAESRIYSPGSQDISFAVQNSSETSQSLSASAEPIIVASAGTVVSDSDRSIEAKIRAAVSEDVLLAQQAPNIQVSAEAGKVMLKGNVGSEQARQQAEFIAQKASGVVSVDNQLVVIAGTVPSPSSASERGRVNAATSGRYSPTSASSTEINAPKATAAVVSEASLQTSIDANASRTRSEVAGEVPSATNQAAVSAQAGTSVTASNLAPTSDRPGSRIYSTNGQGTAASPGSPGATSTESALVIQIRTAISGDVTLSATLPNLTITEDGGKITLHGKARSEQEKRDIEALVQKTTGVTSVDNQLEVSTSP